MVKSGIYMIMNLVNNKVYIGQAMDFDARWKHHLSGLNGNTKKYHNKHLRSAWRKYGSDAFSFQIVEYVADLTLLDEREQVHIDRFDAANPEHGYNLCPAAGSCKGIIRSAETRKKMSEHMMGALNPWFGKTQPPAMVEQKSGENSAKAKLTTAEVDKIRTKWNAGDSTQVGLAEEYGVSPITIRYVIGNTTWKDANYKPAHLGRQTGERHHRAKLTWQQVKEIRDKWRTGTYTQTMLASEYGVNQTTVKNVVNNLTWKVGS